MAGWIKVYRKLRDWEWYSDSHMVHLFIHLLIESNHEDRSWRGQMVKRGQLIFGRKKASETLGISERSLRTCMERLKTTNEVTIKTTSRFSLVTIVNYKDYQSNEDLTTNKTTNKTTNQRPAIDQQSTTPKELKNIRSKERETDVVLPEPTHPLCLWIKKELKNVSRMKNQLTDTQAKNIISKLGKDLVREVLEGMENKSDLTKKYTSVNLTIQSWAKMRIEKNPERIKPKEDHSQREDFYAAYQTPIQQTLAKNLTNEKN